VNNYGKISTDTLSYHDQIVQWSKLVEQFERQELTRFTIDQIHILLNEIQSFISTWSMTDHFFQKVSPVMNSLFTTTQILTGDGYCKNQQLSLENASHQIYLALKTICR
jgi:hypothetical protein